MTLQVVAHNIGDRQGTVTIAGPDMEEVMGIEAKQLALKTAAANGLSKPGISGNYSAYPVDEQGNTDDDLVLGRRRAAGFRVDFPVTGMI